MRLAIVGTGMMAKQHARTFSGIDGVEVVAGVDVRQETLEAFCAEFGIGNRFASVGELLGWGEFDSACVVTPDSAHHGAAVPLLEAGRNVLCEKPLAPNARDAKEMAEAAAKAGTVNMVNFTYRRSAALAKAHEMVRDGAVGTVRHIEAAYLQSWLAQDKWGDWRTEPTWLWRLSTKHGSLGVLGDVGVHILDFACHASCSSVAEVSCMLKTFDKAEGNRIGEYELDANDSFAMTARMDGGALAVVHATRFASGHVNMLRVRVHGDRGGIAVEHGMGGGDAESIRACIGNGLKDEDWQEVETEPVPTMMERFASCVRDGTQGKPDFAHAAALQEVLDAAFESDGKGAALRIPR